MLTATPLFLTLAIGVIVAYAAVSYQTGVEKAEVTTHPWFKLAPAEDNGVFQGILASRKKKDFEEAIAIALNGVDGKPPDDFLLQTVADTYFERAQEEPGKREQWVKPAIQYSARALNANPSDIVNVLMLDRAIFQLE